MIKLFIIQVILLLSLFQFASSFDSSSISFHPKPSPPYANIPTGGICNIYPLWVFVNIRMSIVFRDEHVFSVFAANTKIPICIILK